MRKYKRENKEKVTLKQRLKKTWTWLRKNIFIKEMIWYALIVELVFWSPVIVCGILALTVDKWYWSGAASYIAFWAAPFTPGWTLQIAAMFGLKKAHEKLKIKSKKMETKSKNDHN